MKDGNKLTFLAKCMITNKDLVIALLKDCSCRCCRYHILLQRPEADPLVLWCEQTKSEVPKERICEKHQEVSGWHKGATQHNTIHENKL